MRTRLPASFFKISSFLLACNVFVQGCKEEQSSSEKETATVKPKEFGTFNLLPSPTEEFKDMEAEYRLVSVQKMGGYWVSTDTGKTYVVDENSELKPLVDKSDVYVEGWQRVFATALGETWEVGEKKIAHSKAGKPIDLQEGEFRVLWFGEDRLIACGNYLNTKTMNVRGPMVIKLMGGGLRIIGVAMDTVNVCDKTKPFIAGGLIENSAGGEEDGLWFWSRLGNLQLLTWDESKGEYARGEANISFPKIGQVVKDIGFLPTLSGNEILPPSYAVSVVSGDKNRSGVYGTSPH